MSEALTLARTWVAGGLLGALFFGGLWWTVRKGVSSKRPALWFSGSFVVRMGVVVSGVCVASRGRWEQLLSCLVGLLMASVLVVWLTRTSKRNRGGGQEASHAPYAR
jgi:F1F0 ATPase subunit 2